jgi:hypothetical protein
MKAGIPKNQNGNSIKFYSLRLVHFLTENTVYPPVNTVVFINDMKTEITVSLEPKFF